MRIAFALLCATGVAAALPSLADAELQVGFAHRDITPPIDGKNPVWLAGYGPGRKAESIHDPIFARGLVIATGKKKIAIVSLDVVGLQYGQVLAIRRQLPDFDYVLVASTHNHEGPDVIGLWGPSLVQRGVGSGYLKRVVEDTVKVIQEAASKLQPVQARLGAASDGSLVRDSRQPYVKDEALQTLTFYNSKNKVVGTLAKWSVHPEAMGSRNKALTADFPAWTIKGIQAKHDCPVVLVVGAIGGLMAPPGRGVLDANGNELGRGNFAYTAAYGQLVADLANKAIASGKPIALQPMRINAKQITVPVHNHYYRAARAMRVLQRKAFAWTGNAHETGKPLAEAPIDSLMAIQTEVAYLQLGQLGVPCIPGEIYPELVFGKIEDPPQPNVDFPKAAKETNFAEMAPCKNWLLIGMANDEIGYIIPKRQWDQLAPFAYGRKSSQYGEINSCGPDVAATIMNALKSCLTPMKAEPKTPPAKPVSPAQGSREKQPKKH